jgi:N-acetyl-anhydromuramyl-L-alanine amidase AmpD
VRIIEWLVVHTAGAYDYANRRVVYQSIETIRQFHKLHNGWHDIGYHYVIEGDGRVMPGRSEDTVGAHVGGFNDHSIGICVAGHGDFEPFRPLQLAALIRLLAHLCEQHRLSGIRVMGHREASQHGAPPTAKTCPGLLIDMDEIRRLVGDRLDGEAQ